MKSVLMKKYLLLCATVALGLSACNEDATPTGVGRDLLSNANNAPTLGKSEYVLSDVAVVDEGEIVDVEDIIVSADDMMDDIDFSTVTPDNPGAHIIRGPNKSEYIPTRHVTEGADKSKYHIVGIEHIPEGDNKTQYQTHLTKKHITEGDDRTKYYLVLGPHVTEGDDKTKYLPKGYKHILEGADKTQYVRE